MNKLVVIIINLFFVLFCFQESVRGTTVIFFFVPSNSVVFLWMVASYLVSMDLTSCSLCLCQFLLFF